MDVIFPMKNSEKDSAKSLADTWVGNTGVVFLLNCCCALNMSLCTVSLVWRHFLSCCRRVFLAAPMSPSYHGTTGRTTMHRDMRGAWLSKILSSSESYCSTRASRAEAGLTVHQPSLSLMSVMLEYRLHS